MARVLKLQDGLFLKVKQTDMNSKKMAKHSSLFALGDGRSGYTGNVSSAVLQELEQALPSYWFSQWLSPGIPPKDYNFEEAFLNSFWWDIIFTIGKL